MHLFAFCLLRWLQNKKRQENYRTRKPHMLTMSSDIQVWNRSRKQNKEEATTKNNKRGISTNEAEGVRWQCSKCCTCHAKWDWVPPSAAPAKQKQPASIVFNRRRTSADLSGGVPTAALATQNETEMLRVLHLPRKMRRRSSKCCTCHKYLHIYIFFIYFLCLFIYICIFAIIYIYI